MTRHVVSYRIADDIAFRRFIPSPNELADLNLGVVVQDRRPVIGPSHPTLVFRYPTRNDDTRTLIATALPEDGYLYSKGYVHGLRTDGAEATDILALLGYLNSFICDWWVRRFTDRHMTLPVLTNVPVPDWNGESRTEVAKLVSAMLIRGGTRRLPGGFDLESDAESDQRGDEELIVEIEKHVVSGFGLTYPHLKTALEDFSSNACSQSLRSRFQTALGQNRDRVKRKT